MIRASITLHGYSEKRMEILQTLKGIKEQQDKNTKCRQAKICQDVDDENTFFPGEDWVSEDDLDECLSTKLYKVLLRIQSFLKGSFEVEVFAYLRLVGTH